MYFPNFIPPPQFSLNLSLEDTFTLLVLMHTLERSRNACMKRWFLGDHSGRPNSINIEKERYEWDLQRQDLCWL